MNLFSSVFGSAGVTEIHQGDTVIQIPAPKIRKSLKGFGDKIKIGDVIYCDLKENGKKYSEGHFKLKESAPIQQILGLVILNPLDIYQLLIIMVLIGKGYFA